MEKKCIFVFVICAVAAVSNAVYATEIGGIRLGAKILPKDLKGQGAMACTPNGVTVNGFHDPWADCVIAIDFLGWKATARASSDQSGRVRSVSVSIPIASFDDVTQHMIKAMGRPRFSRGEAVTLKVKSVDGDEATKSTLLSCNQWVTKDRVHINLCQNPQSDVSVTYQYFDTDRSW